MLQSSFIFLLTDNSKKSKTYSFRTNVKIVFLENVILKHWKTIYYKTDLDCDISRRLKRILADDADFYFFPFADLADY